MITLLAEVFSPFFFYAILSQRMIILNKDNHPLREYTEQADSLSRL
jgi:hypothetical protein